MHNSYYLTHYNTGVVVASAISIYILILLFLSILLVIYIFTGIVLGCVFKKAGIPRSAAWVPFYNNWKLFEMGSLHGALSLLVFIPFCGPIIYTILLYIAAYRTGLKFGKNDSFVLLAIFAYPIWLLILAFDKSTWDGITANSQTPQSQPQQTTNIQQ